MTTKNSLIRFAAVVAAAILLLGANAQAEILSFKKGNTVFTLSGTFGALFSGTNAFTSSLDVIRPARINVRGIATFPVTLAALDQTTGLGEIDHSGGLVINTGTTEIVLKHFVITGTGGAVKDLSALVSVNGSYQGRSSIMDATYLTVLPVHSGNNVTLENLRLVLSASGAATLNAAVNGTTYYPGLEVGTLCEIKLKRK